MGLHEISLAGALMVVLMADDFPQYKAAARGPFSYVDRDGTRITHADGVTFCASTYLAMMRYGWVKEVA